MTIEVQTRTARGHSNLFMLGALGLAAAMSVALTSIPPEDFENSALTGTSTRIDRAEGRGISALQGGFFAPKSSNIRKFSQFGQNLDNKNLTIHVQAEPEVAESTPSEAEEAQTYHRMVEPGVKESDVATGSAPQVVARTERGAWDRAADVEELAEVLEGRRAAAWAVARAEGWEAIGSFSPDAGHELMAVIGGTPYEYVTDNANAAISTAVDAARGLAAGGLDGSGVSVGIWDEGAVRTTHRELLGRVEVLDGSSAVNHATHAGGTIAAAGVSASARGMAPAVRLLSSNWSSDLAEMAELAMSEPGEPGTIQVSSHSYGFVSGWAPQYNPPRWYGNTGEAEGENFGLYDWYAAKWDELCYNAPYYLPFKSSGNNRIDDAPAPGVEYKYYDGGWQTKAYDPAIDPAGDGDANGGYDTIPLIGNAKNVMTVGAVNDAVVDGRRDPGAADMTAFSGWGPTDDGRVKPDIVADGASLYSTKNASDSDYGYMSGTSMSTPSAAGSAALLVQLYGELFPGKYLPAGTLKGLILHTADDLGNDGPDYQFGWGLMNALAAARQLEDHAADPAAGLLRELSLTDAQVQTITMRWDGVSPIRVTLCWTDPAGQQEYALDDRTPRLVNDLDLRLVDATGEVYEPFVLDPGHPAAPATTGDNIVDNVEQVRIDAPIVPGVYRVVISTKGALRNGSQNASLIVSGLGAVSEPPAVHLDGAVAIDNVGPDGSEVAIAQEHRAFGRYVLDSSFTFGWSNFADLASGVAGYYVGVDDVAVENAMFLTNETATVQGLAPGRESTIYLWAVDGAGNLSDPVSLVVYPLNAEGYWNGTGIPDPAFTQGQSTLVDAPQTLALQADMADHVPVLRWPYQAGRQYAIQHRRYLNSGADWTVVEGAQFSIDSGWVIWANRDIDAAKGLTGFFRVISE